MGNSKRQIDNVITYNAHIMKAEDYIINNTGRKLTSKEVMDACNISLHNFLIAWRNATRWDGYKGVRTSEKIKRSGKLITYTLVELSANK